MFKKFKALYTVCLYLFILYVLVLITANLFVNNTFITYNIRLISFLFTNLYFIYFFLGLYIIINTLAFLESIFSRNNKEFTVKLDNGTISVKSDTLNTFASNYLTKNYLIEKVKVRSYKKGSSKVNMDIVVYTYEVVEISKKLLELQKELSDEIERTLMLKLNKINILIANLNTPDKDIQTQAINDIDMDENK